MLVQNYDTGSMAECPRQSGMTICLARRVTSTPLVCHRRPPPAGAFTSSCPGRARVPRHAAAR